MRAELTGLHKGSVGGSADLLLGSKRSVRPQNSKCLRQKGKQREGAKLELQHKLLSRRHVVTEMYAKASWRSFQGTTASHLCLVAEVAQLLRVRKPSSPADSRCWRRPCPRPLPLCPGHPRAPSGLFPRLSRQQPHLEALQGVGLGGGGAVSRPLRLAIAPPPKDPWLLPVSRSQRQRRHASLLRSAAAKRFSRDCHTKRHVIGKQVREGGTSEG